MLLQNPRLKNGESRYFAMLPTIWAGGGRGEGVGLILVATPAQRLALDPADRYERATAGNMVRRANGIGFLGGDDAD